jgi:hypothetical protein
MPPFPKVINSQMIRQMADEGMASIRNLAEEYNATKNLPAPTHGIDPTPVNPHRGKSIAKAFEKMEHTPNDPAVRKSYEALSNETVDQFKHLQKSGLKVSPIPPGTESPYKSSTDVFNDIHQNKHLWYYPTEQGFGSGGIQDNPLLNKVKVGDKEMPVNDLFRIVHDYYGHAKEGYKFGATGEEAAWKQHLQMFSPEAQKAMTTETRGQNSWVNFGPHGEANRANPAQTIYAEQKTGLLPPWVMEPTGAPPKYSEPRGILRRSSPTSHEIVVPQQFNDKNVSMSGSSPDEALTAYRSIYGDEMPNVKPNPEALSKRLQAAKQTQNSLNPEEATQILTKSDIHKIAGLGGAAALGLNTQRSEAEEINPLPKIGSGIDWYKQNIQQPISETSEDVAKHLIGHTTPLQGEQKQAFINENAPIVGGIINPTNYVPYLPEAEIGAESFNNLRKKLNNTSEDEQDNTLP